MPDTVSLLLIRSGDIETNPGPDSCKDCGRNFTPTSVPVTCMECQGKFCKTTRGSQKTTCIGLTRWKQERALEANRPITCRLCKGESPRKAHPFNEGVTPGRCAMPSCKTKMKIRKGDDFMLCSKCFKQFHITKRECCGLYQKEAKSIDRSKWECLLCRAEEEEMERRTAESNPSETEANYEKVRGKETRLKILQLNIDCLTSKTEELKHRGGGLLIGIKKTIPYKYLNKLSIIGPNDRITESQSIEIPTINGQKVRITNMYVPPYNSPTNGVAGTVNNRRGQEDQGNQRQNDRYFDASKWPKKEYDMICGDINAHSLLWDDSRIGREADIRGKTVEEWIANSDMKTINDGTPTHDNRTTGTGSAPDICMAHTAMISKLEWETKNELSSDHRPIIITYTDCIPIVNSRMQYKWRLKDGDWAKFTEAVEQKIPANYAKKNINKMEKILRKAITKAANKYIRKKKVTENTKCYLTEEIRAEIKKRNTLRKTVAANRDEWIESCKNVAKMIKDEKTNRWKDYLTRINGKSDSREIFRTVRAIDGKYVPRKENEVLEVEGKIYISDRQKAEQFAKTYRKFSKLEKRKEDRKIRKIVRRQWKTSRTMEECEQDLTMKELVDVIQDASMNKASGNDDIPYEMIKRLGSKAREMLLYLINKCWSGVGVPTKWREATIKPLLKEGKDPKDPTSYRPISLTSCLGKIFEKMVANRLIYILENRGILTDNQAGFRPGRCTTDQILKLIQQASDNMHEKPRGRRTIATFFDYSKAYDTVWRDGLLYKMIQYGIQHRFIRYTRHFLSGRKTVVSYNNTNTSQMI